MNDQRQQFGTASTYHASTPATLGSSNSSVRELEIHAQVGTLEPSADDLHALVSKLEERLCHSVMRPATESKNEPMPRAVANTQLGGRLQSVNDSLMSLAGRLNGLMDRLEV